MLPPESVHRRNLAARRAQDTFAPEGPEVAGPKLGEQMSGE